MRSYSAARSFKGFCCSKNGLKLHPSLSHAAIVTFFIRGLHCLASQRCMGQSRNSYMLATGHLDARGLFSACRSDVYSCWLQDLLCKAYPVIR